MLLRFCHILIFCLVVILSLAISPSIEFSISQFSVKYLVPFLLLSCFIFVLIQRSHITVYISGLVVLMPIFIMLRDMVEIKLALLHLDIFSLFLLSCVVVSLRSPRVEDFFSTSIFGIFYILFSCTMVFLTLYTKNFLIISFFYAAILTPLILADTLYYIFKKRTDFDRLLYYLIALSFFIFFLQVLYIGPITFIESSRNQTWLLSGTSIASGGFIEVGTMQLVLIPLAYLYLSSSNSKTLVKNFYLRIYLKLASLFIILSPIILFNRVNALLSIFLFVTMILPRLTKRQIATTCIIIFPFAASILYQVIIYRSFVMNGHSVNLLGIELVNLDYTTLTHIQATVEGFSTLLSMNIFSGVGPFLGGEVEGAIFEVGNFRNFLFPFIKPFVSLGFLYFSLHLIFSLTFFLMSKGLSARYIAVLPFLPALGTSRLMDLYVTGELSYKVGFLAMNDPTPVAIYSFSLMLLYVHILLARLHRPKPYN